jgi:histidinol-phosphate aminotransferase
LTCAFEVDADALLAAITAQTKLVFLCSPNNPTGGALPLNVVTRIARELTGRALVVVDEAYLEFAGDVSATSLLPHCTNVAVLRTLSKAYALAGARIGALIAAPDVIALLRRIQAPYPLPLPCVEAAMAALAPAAREQAATHVAISVRERERLATLLAAVPGVRTVLPSRANFLCVRFDNAALVYRRLLERGIVVRDVGAYPGLANCLRISIGTPQENASLMSALGVREAAA